MTFEPTQDHLSKLWQESSQELAVAFLRRAIRPELTLTELLATLEFPNLNADLKDIRLRDVLQAATPTPAAVVPEATPATPVRSLSRLSGKRRRPQQTAQLKAVLLDQIRAHGSGIRTPELSTLLCNKGFEVDTATANLILKSMEDAGQIVGDDGRPRLWRAKAVGRTVPEPVVIRKAPIETAALAATAPAANKDTGGNGAEQAALLSQSEVAAAAAALRERFFASK